MSHRIVYLSAVIALVALGHALAVSEEDPMQPSPERMKRIQEITSPGKQHEAMKYFLGRWEVRARLSMPSPAGVKESPPETMVSTFEWVIPGRWMSESLEGSLMGHPYRGYLIHGYDNHTKNHVSCGVSNMDTAMNLFRGVQVDPADQVSTQYGTINEWMDDTFNKPVKVVVRRVDDDHFDTEIWDLQIGEQGHPVLKFHYTRSK